MAEGPVQSTIFVDGYDQLGNSYQSTCRVYGEVEPEFSVLPSSVDFGVVHKAGDNIVEVVLTPRADKSAKLVDARIEGVDFSIVEDQVDASNGVRIAVDPARPFVPGLLEGRLAIVTSSSRIPILELPVRATYEPLVSLSPASAVLSDRRPEELITIRSVGQKLRFLSSDLSSSDIDIASDSDAFSSQCRLTVQLTGEPPTEAQSLQAYLRFASTPTFESRGSAAADDTAFSICLPISVLPTPSKIKK